MMLCEECVNGVGEMKGDFLDWKPGGMTNFSQNGKIEEFIALALRAASNFR